MPSKTTWRPEEPGRDALYHKIQDRLANQDSCITFLLVELRAVQKRLEKLEKPTKKTPAFTGAQGGR